MALAAGFWWLAYLYVTLPDVRPLATVNPSTTAFMERRLAEAQAAGRQLRLSHRWVPYGRVSPHLKRAVLVAEDSAFWQHQGLDFEQIKESIEHNLERRQLARGASTITQQLAKNLYLSPARDPTRKIREVMLARRLEAVLSKRRILELYLNVIEWGDGIFGAEAAARTYFGVSAASLDPEQAALLAGAIINPRVHNPARPTARLLRRQRIILSRMGAVTPPAESSSADAAEPPRPPAPDVPAPGSPATPASAEPAQPDAGPSPAVPSPVVPPRETTGRLHHP